MNKIAKFFYRHPLACFVRYILTSKKVKTEQLGDIGCFNDFNTISAVPKNYFEINTQIGIDDTQDECEKAMQIGNFLRSNTKVRPGIGLLSEETLNLMLSQKGGVCFDFSPVFNIFCFIHGIKVKEWGCIDRFYKTEFGHIFNEIYVTIKKKWIAIDIHKDLVFKDDNDILLSVLELFSRLRLNRPNPFQDYSEYLSPHVERIPKVYSAITIPFLVGNNNIEVKDHYFEKYKKALSPVAINLLLIIAGKNATFLFVLGNYRTKLLPKLLQ